MNTGNQGFIFRSRLPIPSGLTGFFNQFINGVNRHLLLLVAEHHGVEHHVFGQAIGFGFDHQHGAFGTGHHEVQPAFGHLGDLRVADEFTVDVAHAASTDRAVKRNTGNGQSSRSTQHGGNIGIDFRISREHVNDHLHFVKEAFREKRTDRTVDQAGG